jgi:type IV pilus biogenesis protein CpaD/CtpE
MKVLSVIALALLAGCASTHSQQHGADYCAEYRATMAGKSVEEQRKAAAEHIVKMHGTADAAHIDRHMKMMGT